jgi:nitrous oxidase accessory protein NosD
MQGISADQRFQRSISLSIGANLIEENLDPSLPVRPNLGTYNGVGIWLQDVQDAVVANNTIRKSGLGTFALKSNDIKYSGNKITETAGAFLLFDTLSFSLYNNTFSENDGGLFIGGGFGGGQESCKGAIFSEIWGNQIINNKGAGISLCAVNKLKLFDNVISGNEYGLFILFSENLAEQDFTCERNRVVDNTKGNYVAFNFSTVNPLSLIQPNEALRKKCEGN